LPAEPLSPRPARFAGSLAVALAALIVAGSLYPFAGWQASGLPPWDFLSSGWPRYWTVTDLVVNALAYLPLGFALTVALRHRFGIVGSAALTLLLLAALSLAVEALQHYLPTRIPSQLDLLCNLAGGALGMLLAQLLGARAQAGEARFGQLLARAPYPAAGLVLVLFWLLAQASPAAVFATTGDARPLFGALLLVGAEHGARLETLAVAGHFVAAGLLINRLFGRSGPALPAMLLCFLLAAAGKALVAAVWLAPAAAFEWLTPATTRGLVFGAVALASSLLLLPSMQRILALLALALGCAAINLIPEAPYRGLAPQSWQLGPYVNISGLTRWLGLAWAPLALGWLAAGPWQRKRWHEGVFGRSL
jgi:VanZ family protein